MKEFLNPILSIVVPVYNVECYLRRCLDSIIGQLYTNLEIILVDDGSTDSSGMICDEYAKKDKRIKVIHKGNRGLVSARKAGTMISTGEYITYVDSDDWIDCNMYDELMKEIIENDADIVTSGLYRDYIGHVVIETDNVSEGGYWKNQIVELIYPCVMYAGEFYKAGINIHVFNKIYKTDLLRKKQLEIDDEINVGEDAALVYPCILAANKIVVTHKCYYHYCARDNSIMGIVCKQEYEKLRLLFCFLESEIRKYTQYEMLLKQLKYLIYYLMLLRVPQMLIKLNERFLIEPFDMLPKGSRIILYGAGKFGKIFYEFVNKTKACEVVLWVDRKENLQRGVYKTEKIKDMDKTSYDHIVIGVLVESVIKEIVDKLCDSGIDENKIVRIKEINEWDDLFENMKSIDNSLIK